MGSDGATTTSRWEPVPVDAVRCAHVAEERAYDTVTPGPARAGHGGGVGLGLCIVHNLLEGNGGTVHAARNRYSGSTFTVRLPAVGR